MHPVQNSLFLQNKHNYGLNENVSREKETKIASSIILQDTKTIPACSRPFPFYLKKPKIVSNSLEEQLDLIEEFINENKVSQAIETVEYFVSYILNHSKWSIERKKAELGILYYYLTISYLPDKKEISLIDVYWEKVSCVLKKMKEDHNNALPEEFCDLIPSGRHFYLINELAWLAYCPDGNFNPGGCAAIHILLERYCYKTLGESLTSQIDLITKCLDNKTIVNLFTSPCSLHSDFKLFIPADLKLHLSVFLSNIQVSHFLFVHFFSLQGQQITEDCFAVAPHVYFFTQHLHSALLIMRSWMQKGHIEINGTPIPISFFFQPDEFEDRSLHIPLQAASIEKLPCLSLIRQAIGFKEHVVQSTSVTLSEYFTGFYKNKLKAQILFSTFKHSVVHNLTKKILIFVNNNIVKNENNAVIFSYRKNFFRSLSSFITKNSYVPYLTGNEWHIFHNYMKNLEKKFNESFWFSDFSSGAKILIGDRIFFKNFAHGVKLSKQLKECNKPFVLRGLYFLFEGKLILISTLSEVSNYFSVISELALRECFGISLEKQQEIYPKAILAIKKINEIIYSEDFKKFLANFVHENNKFDLSWASGNYYYESNALFLLNTGGRSFNIYNWNGLDNIVKSKEIYSRNIKEFFANLCRFILKENNDHENLFSHPGSKTILNCYGTRYALGHEFNISPNNFLEYWSNPLKKIALNIVEPGQKLQERILTIEEQKQILSGEFEKFQSEIKEQITVRDFQSNLRNKIPWRDFYYFFDILEAHLLQIEKQTFFFLFNKFLQKIKLNLDEKEKIKLVSILRAKLSKKETFSPYELANAFLKAMEKERHAKIHLHLLDNNIRQMFLLPQVIDMGEIGWAPQGILQEDSDAEHLILRYSLSKNRLECATRSNAKGIVDLNISYPNYFAHFKYTSILLQQPKVFSSQY